MAKHEFASISVTVQDRAISSKFSTHRVSKECNLCNFQKNFPSPKMAAILNFRIFVSTKFLTHRVSKECNLCNFQKNFPSPKMAAIFEFLPKMAKHKFASISVTVQDRAISSKFSTHRVSKECNLCNFQKNFPSPKMAAILNFRIFAKNGKTRICFRSPSHETHTVASKATLAHARESGKGHSVAPLSPSTPRLVVKQGQCTSRPTIAPSTCSSKVYRRLKLRLGCTLRGLHCKRHLVSYRKSPLHQLSGVKSSLPGPLEFRASLQRPDCIDNNRQHNCSLLHQ